MKRYLLIGCLLLTGCYKDRNHNPGSFFPAAAQYHRSGGPLKVLIMGQSNAAYMSPSGTASFQVAVDTPTQIVNCAVPGSYINDWMPGAVYYQACLNKMPYPDAIVWYQGEADAAPNGDYLTWGAKFLTIVLGWRTQAGGPIPIVFAQIARDQTNDYPGFPLPGWLTVKAQQANLHLANAVMITTDDLPADGIHFQPSGYTLLGTRFGEALKQLIK